MKTLDANFRSLIPQVSIKLIKHILKRRISIFKVPFFRNQGESETCVPLIRLPLKNC